MRWNDFGRSLVFAAVVAAAWPAFALVAAPPLGGNMALSLYLVAAATICAWGLAPDRARGAGAALALGVARSGLVYRARAARALLLESLLIGGGLMLARWLAASGPFGIALALCGLFAVQAGFFAVGGVRVRRAEPGVGDRFEQARRRALALREERTG